MEINESIIIPVITAVVELLKNLGMPKKMAPFVAILLGVGVAFIYLDPGNIKNAILLGLTYGLAATGLYSGTRSTVNMFRNRK